MPLESTTPVIRVVQVLEATAGGTRRHLGELLAALPPDEFDVRLVCAARRDPSFREDMAGFLGRGVEVHELPMVRAPHPLWDPVAALRLRALLRARPCDILHLHSSKAGWLGRLAAWNLDCTVVYSPHGFAFLQRTPWPRAWIFETAERLAARRTDVLLAVGRAEGALAVERGLCDPERLRVIPNAVDSDALEARVGARRSLPSAPAERVLGFIGELRPQKDPLVFLEALRILWDRGHPFRAVLPAQGSLLGAARRFLAGRRLTERIELIPPDGSLVPIYRRMDVAVLPSRWEGLPYALLDALALGVPVLGSDIAPIAEVLRPLDPRLLFRAGSAESLADQTAVLLSAPEDELRAIGERGKVLVRGDHDAAAWRRSIQDLYRSLAQAPVATEAKSSFSRSDDRRRSKRDSA